VLPDDRLVQILQILAILLFVSVGALPLGHTRSVWTKWAKWGSIVVFSVAALSALILIMRWALNLAPW